MLAPELAPGLEGLGARALGLTLTLTLALTPTLALTLTPTLTLTLTLTLALTPTLDLQDGDVYFCTADCGWITGH